MEAKLYLCATPIGNLGDITRRAERVLMNAERIYCEDTRNTLKLLNALGIRPGQPLRSCHEHNEQRAAAEIAELVRKGGSAAFVSDAGMPGVSDPGSRLVAEFIREGLPFEVLPGASAMVTAWVASGLSTEGLLFLGFLPRTGPERAKMIDAAAKSEVTAMLYESPLRVGATLAELACAFEKRGEEERQCVLMRELTKTFEERIAGTASALKERFMSEPPKGECVLLIEGTKKDAALEAAAGKLDGLLDALLREGLSVKSAVAIACSALELPKNTVYKRAMELSRE